MHRSCAHDYHKESFHYITKIGGLPVWHVRDMGIEPDVLNCGLCGERLCLVAQLENYHEELEEMRNMSRLAYLRRKSSGFSRGASMYRGVTRHHQYGRWQARIGRVAGNKDLYLGTFEIAVEPFWDAPGIIT